MLLFARTSFRNLLLLLPIIFLNHCGNNRSTSEYLSVSGVQVILTDGVPVQFPVENNIVLTPSSSYMAKHLRVNIPSQTGSPMTLQIMLDPNLSSNIFLTFTPDESPDEPIIFSPYNFNFPQEWRLTASNTPGIFEAVLPAQSGTLTLHELNQVATSSDLLGTGETCDKACDDKLCCGKFKCWSFRISVCAAEGRDPDACWSCLCEMSWGCLSHHHDRCKSSCNTCNQNTWSGTHEHCIDKL